MVPTRRYRTMRFDHHNGCRLTSKRERISLKSPYRFSIRRIANLPIGLSAANIPGGSVIPERQAQFQRPRDEVTWE
jgi:hypothetical protein